MLSSTLSRLFSTEKAASAAVPEASGAEARASLFQPSRELGERGRGADGERGGERSAVPRQLPPMISPTAPGQRVGSTRAGSGERGVAGGDAECGEYGDYGRRQSRGSRGSRGSRDSRDSRESRGNCGRSSESPEDPDIRALLDAADREITRGTASTAAEKRKSRRERRGSAAGALPGGMGAVGESAGISGAQPGQAGALGESSPLPSRASPSSQSAAHPAASHGWPGPGRGLGGSLTLNSLLEGGASRGAAGVPVDMSMPYADVARLRDLLRAANKRVEELEAELAELKAKTRLTGGSGIDDLLWQTQGANGMTSRDILRPMPPDEPPSWQRDKERLATRIRDLVLTMHKERTVHESVERAQKLEIMGLTRRLKYALMQIQGLHKKEQEQARYISDCEAAILKQQGKIRVLESRGPSGGSRGPGKSRSQAGGTGSTEKSLQGSAHASAQGIQGPPQSAEARSGPQGGSRVRPGAEQLLGELGGRVSSEAPRGNGRQGDAGAPAVLAAPKERGGPGARGTLGTLGPADASDASEGSYSYYSSEEEEEGERGAPGAPEVPGSASARAGAQRVGQRVAQHSGDESSGYSYSSSERPSLRDVQLVGREDLVAGDLDPASIQRAAIAIAPAEANGPLDPLTVPQEDLTVEGL